MNKKTLKRQLKKVKAFENLLMRELTDAETECLLEKGDEAMLEMLGWTEEELKTFEDIKRLIMLYCTEDVETFDEYVHSNDLSLAYFVLKTICNELEAAKSHEHLCTKPEPECEEKEVCKEAVVNKKSDEEDHEEPVWDMLRLFEYLNKLKKQKEPSHEPFYDYIADLKIGKELTLDTKTINEIEDYLWEHYDNVVIKVKDNKISAKF